MLRRLMLILGLLSCAMPMHAQEKANAALLSDNGLPATTVERVLPTGAVAHLRFNNLGKTIQDCESFVLTFLPKEMIPPRLAKVFEKPNPLLTLLGMNALGEAISPSSLATATGIDISRPLAVTLYPRKNDPLVIAVPIANHTTFARFLTGLGGARRFTPTTHGTIVISTKPDFPKQLYVTCSSNYAFICLGEDMLGTIHDKKVARMSTGKVIPKAVSQYKDDDVVMIGDPIAGKAFIEKYKAFNTIPEEALIRVRQLIARNLTRRIRPDLMSRLGIQDVDTMLGYAEAFITAGYESLFEFLTARIDRFHGVAFSVKIGETEQKVCFSVYSDDIGGDGRPQALNMKEIVKVLDRIPGPRNKLTIQGRTPELKPSGIGKIFLQKLKPKFKRYMLDIKYYVLFANWINNQQTIQPISSHADWMLTFQYGRPGALTASTGAADYLKRLMETSIGGGSGYKTYSVIGGMNEKGLKEYYRKVATQKNTNRNVDLQFIDGMHWNRPFFIKEARAFTDRTPGLITIESSYTSKAGFFDYDEHEFINRKFVHYRTMADQLVVSEGRNPFGNSILKVKVGPLPPSMRSLLEKVPKDAHYVQAGRTLHRITGLVDHLQGLETKLHEEIETYKIKVDNINRKALSDREKILEIRRLEMPLTVTAVYYDRERQKLDLVLVGNGRFPRPKIMDVVKPLFANYRAVEHKVGGGVVYNRVTDGQVQQTAIQKTDAFAALVRSVVGTFYQTYVATGQGPRGFVNRMVVPGDGQRPRGLVVINPLWSSFYRRYPH